MRKQNKVFGYLKDKGFYIALAVCIVGASASAWTLANRTLESIDENNGQIVNQPNSTEVKPWDDPTTQVDEKAEVIKPSPPSSSSSVPESAAGSVTKPADSSEVPEQQPVQQTVSYRWPVSGSKIITPYSAGELVKNKTLNVWRTHNSIDIAGEKGDEVMAVGEGTITAVSNDVLWGGMIQIEHPDGHVSVYCGVTAKDGLVSGKKVNAGDPIGTIDSIPAEISMEPHIHLTISKNGKEVDPATLLPSPQ